MNQTLMTSATGGTQKKWLSTVMILIYGIVATIIALFTAGGLTTTFRILALLFGIVGLIMVIMDTVKKRGSMKGWMLFIVYAILFYITANVSII